jgi:phage-related baseplate assembly protein
VLDATAVSPDPCDVVVSVLSAESDGTASEELLDIVRAALNDEEVRPLGDRVTVQSSVIVDYSVRAKLHMKTSGPGREQAIALATTRVTEFVSRRQRQGWSVWLDKLDSLLHVEGVERVEIEEPAAHIVLDESQAARCIAIDVADADAPVEP